MIYQKSFDLLLKKHFSLLSLSMLKIIVLIHIFMKTVISYHANVWNKILFKKNNNLKLLISKDAFN